MYESRQQEQRKSAYTSPSTGPVINDAALQTRRRLHDIELRSTPPQSTAGGRVQWELDSSHVDDSQSAANSDHEHRRYSSPGEELVYREMMEQQVRETELRQHWKQVYGVHIDPPPGDNFLVATSPETEVRDKTGNDNDRRRSLGGEHVVRSDRNTKNYSTPAAFRTVNNSKNVRFDENENGLLTSAAGTASDRRGSRQVVGRTSDGERGRHGGLEYSKDVGRRQPEVRWTDEDSDPATTTRNEAEQRVEQEIIEVMRREQELRQLREAMRRVDMSSDTATEGRSGQ